MKQIYLFLFFFWSLAQAQVIDLDKQRQIVFPDIPGYKTLKCDLHQHTVFSDGSVWPTIRVNEALKDNLDAIAVTEHLEYQPHKHDIPHPDRNRAYEIEKSSTVNLIIINGSEITRDMPPGHANAIFLKDANKLLVDDSVEVFREARKQDAFIFWNHPNWTAHKNDGIAELTDMHHMLIKEGLLDGIEVVNETTYSDEALQIALDYNLTIIGTSDIHGLVDWEYRIPEGGHRPVTLVFSKEKSKKGIKEGLNDRRTAVYFKNLLIGRDTYLLPLINSSLFIVEAQYQKDKQVLNVLMRNTSSAEFTLQNTSKYTFHDFSDLVKIKPHSDLKIEVKTRNLLKEVSLDFKVLNAINAPNSHPDISLKTKINLD